MIEIWKFDASKKNDMKALEALTCRQNWFHGNFPCPSNAMIYSGDIVFFNSYIFVAVDTTTQEVVGYMAIADHPRLRLWTLNLAASRAFKNASFKGVGTKLMARVVEDAKNRGNVDFIVIETSTEAGEGLYRKFGFRNMHKLFKNINSPGGILVLKITNGTRVIPYKEWRSEMRNIEVEMKNLFRAPVKNKNSINRAIRFIDSYDVKNFMRLIKGGNSKSDTVANEYWKRLTAIERNAIRGRAGDYRLVRQRHPDPANFARELKALGWSLDQTNYKTGMTPLGDAVLKNNLPLARKLLEAGALPSVQMNRQAGLRTGGVCRGTPLHIAHSPEMVRLLMNHGANIRAHNAFGNTPLKTAISKKKNARIIDMLSSK